MTGTPLFADPIEAGGCGPMVHGIHERHAQVVPDARDIAVINATMRKYGGLTAFDLMKLTRRADGAWRSVRERGGTLITDADILASADGSDTPMRTLAAGLDAVMRK